MAAVINASSMWISMVKRTRTGQWEKYKCLKLRIQSIQSNSHTPSLLWSCTRTIATQLTQRDLLLSRSLLLLHPHAPGRWRRGFPERALSMWKLTFPYLQRLVSQKASLLVWAVLKVRAKLTLTLGKLILQCLCLPKHMSKPLICHRERFRLHLESKGYFERMFYFKKSNILFKVNVINIFFCYIIL